MSSTTKPPFALNAVGKPALSLAKGGFLVSKDFLFHQHSWWFIFAEATIQKGGSLSAVALNMENVVDNWHFYHLLFSVIHQFSAVNRCFVSHRTG